MSHFHWDRYATGSSPLHRLSADAKLLLFPGLALVAVTVPSPTPEGFLRLGALGILVLVLAALSRIPARYLLSRVAMLLPFVLMTFLFRVGGKGGIRFLEFAALKASLSVACLVLLASTTPFGRMLVALGRWKTPTLILQVLAFAYRYLFVIVEESERLVRALRSRGWEGRWLHEARTLGQLVGHLFIRSYERGERVYLAMASRGFDGTRRLEGPGLGPGDLGVPVLLLLAAILIRFAPGFAA